MPIAFTSPAPGTQPLPDDLVTFSGLCPDGVDRVRLMLSGPKPLFLGEVPVFGGTWSLATRVGVSGACKLLAETIGGLVQSPERVEMTIAVRGYGELAPIPKGVNPKLSTARHATMLELLGKPGALTDDCSAVTGAKVKKLLVTKNVGPFEVQGLKPAIAALERIFARVKVEKPVLYSQLGTAGMTCCRRIRPLPGKPKQPYFSNHSWGTAIDIKVGEKLDPRADAKAQRGLAALAPYFNAEGFYWGAGFSAAIEDSMHFEVAEETMKKWNKAGLLTA
jgi:hypothetical protein